MLSIKEMHVVDCLFPLSVSVALAVVLAVAILGVLAVLGYCFLKNKRKSHQPVATSSPLVVYNDYDQQLIYNSTTAKA